MAHVHNRVTDIEQAAIDEAKAALVGYLDKVVKASMTTEVLARHGFRYTGYDGKARKWRLELNINGRTVVSEGTLHHGVSTYIASTKVKGSVDG